MLAYAHAGSVRQQQLRMEKLDQEISKARQLSVKLEAVLGSGELIAMLSKSVASMTTTFSTQTGPKRYSTLVACVAVSQHACAMNIFNMGARARPHPGVCQGEVA